MKKSLTIGLPLLGIGAIVGLMLHTSDMAKLYPNRTLTPGALATEWTIQDICTNGTGQYRNVPDSEKQAVAKEYGIAFPSPGYEYDHWYPLGAGGANDIKNLWPMPAPQFHWKDTVEAYLNRQVCGQKMTVEDAKKVIDTWYDFYQKNFKNKLGSMDCEEGCP